MVNEVAKRLANMPECYFVALRAAIHDMIDVRRCSDVGTPPMEYEVGLYFFHVGLSAHFVSIFGAH